MTAVAVVEVPEGGAGALLALLRAPEWWRRASCRGALTFDRETAEAMWAERKAGGHHPPPVSLPCATCPVTRQCAATAVELAGQGHLVGTWGGERLPASGRNYHRALARLRAVASSG